MFRKITHLFIPLLFLSISVSAQNPEMHLALLNINTIPDTISSGEVYGFSFQVQNLGTQPISVGEEIGIMLSVNHDAAQQVGKSVNLNNELAPNQTTTITIPSYQFESARCGGGPALDIIVWPTVMKQSNQVIDSVVKGVIFISAAAFRIDNDFISGVSSSIDINTTYSLQVHAENIGLQPNLNHVEFFVQIDKRDPVILQEVSKVIPVGDIINTSIQTFKLSELDKSFVFDNSQSHVVTIGARESGTVNANQKAIYSLHSGSFPVELLHFEAQALIEKNAVGVNWTTAVETNNKEFRIEKLNIQNAIFETIATAPSQGNSAKPQNYSILDPKPDLGRNLYRIAQIDVDGTVRILSTAELSYSLEEPFHVLGIAPNPTKDNIIFNFFNNYRQELTIDIYSMDGRKVVATKTEKQTGSLTLDIDISSLNQGMYLYRVSGLYKDVTGKFIKE